MKINELKKILDKRIVILDGSMGTLIQQQLPGYKGILEALNLENPDFVGSIHESYIKAGADIILTNTFGASPIKLEDSGYGHKAREINLAGVQIARNVSKGKSLVAGCIGSSGKFIKPIGTLDFDYAMDSYLKQVSALAEGKPDLLIIETMSDIRELKAALMACKQLFDGVVIAQMTFTEDGRTITGTDPLSFGVVATSLKADIIGINCSVGPEEIYPSIKILADNFPNPISIEPNAGLPVYENGQTVFEYSPEKFNEYAKKFAKLGVNLIGGCCGTSPEYIVKIAETLKGFKPKIRKVSKKSYLASRTKAILIDDNLPTRIVGERINPTSRKKLQKELLSKDYSTVREESTAQFKAGADVLDINVGIPQIDEIALMRELVSLVQVTVNTPLSIDTPNPEVLEAGLKEVEGKCLINSTNGEEKNLNKILPLAVKYGAAVIGLTMDENGLPKSLDDRIRIAEKIIEHADSYGLPREDIYIDFLTLTISVAKEQTMKTLEAIPIIKKKWGVRTVLGVSNISHGLPSRDLINSTFLAIAISKGLDLAIINPLKEEMQSSRIIADLIVGKEKDLVDFTNRFSKKKVDSPKTVKPAKVIKIPDMLYSSILTGAKDRIIPYIDSALKDGLNPLLINNDYLVPAMTEVGKKFKAKEYFLPQVIMSAETMKIALDRLRKEFTKDFSDTKKGLIMLSTVKGDIHDIGKNIVGAVLESRGFKILDLGKNIDLQVILKNLDAGQSVNIIGLSALMTTTMGAMVEVIEGLDKEGLKIPVIVGGAVVTGKFAKSIGAAGYAKDAIDAATLCDDLLL